MNFHSCVRGLYRPLTNQWLLVMKLALFLTFLTVVQVTASTYAQRVTMHARDMSLNEAMKQVQNQTGYLFFFRGKDVAYTRVDAQINDAGLAEAMDQLLEGLPLMWTLDNKTIIISRSANKIPTAVVETTVKQLSIKGRVVDETGSPIPGATVAIKGTAVAVTTDELGDYQLTVSDDGSTLVFIMLGFETQEHAINGSSVINVTMKASISDLDEVVVV